jgi:Flp pilus assembly pilin Flp
MKSGFWNLVLLLQALKDREDGQDLVEYAMVVALVGLGGFVGVESAAHGILTFFQGVISVIDTNFP